MPSGWHIYRCQEYLTQNEEVQCDLCYVYQERSAIDRQRRGGADRLCTFEFGIGRCIDHDPSLLALGQHSANIYKHGAICGPMSIGGHESGTLLTWLRTQWPGTMVRRGQAGTLPSWSPKGSTSQT